MIHVLRNRNDDNGNPIQPPDNWFDRAAGKKTQAITQGQNHNPDATIYGHDSLRRALLELFYNKCAYCETMIAGGFDWEVEHFRPKGRVAERPEHPGYYWLTYEWDNLYTGCTHCNQRRRDRGTWENPQVGPSEGKLDQFPLRDESKRAMDHTGSIPNEENVRLLIDPCKDNPESELTFDLLGDAQPINSGDRATSTIKVLHLNRSDLSKIRRLEVVAVHELFERLAQDLDTATFETVRETFLNERTKERKAFAGLFRAIQRDPSAFGF